MQTAEDPRRGSDRYRIRTIRRGSAVLLAAYIMAAALGGAVAFCVIDTLKRVAAGAAVPQHDDIFLQNRTKPLNSLLVRSAFSLVLVFHMLRTPFDSCGAMQAIAYILPLILL